MSIKNIFILSDTKRRIKKTVVNEVSVEADIITCPVVIINTYRGLLDSSRLVKYLSCGCNIVI